MKKIKPALSGIGLELVNHGAAKKGYFKKRLAKHDIVLNVDFKDAMIRFGIMLLLPELTLFIDKHLIIYTAPVIAYLFLSAIIHFCIVKYVWHRYIKHEPVPVSPKYGEDPNYPEESI